MAAKGGDKGGGLGRKGGMSFPREVEALIAAQAREIERLRAEVAQLRRRLGLDSTTSSKPPSSDGLKKSGVFPAAFMAVRARRAGDSGAIGRHAAANGDA